MAILPYLKFNLDFWRENSNFYLLGIKDSMSRISLDVVGGLIEVSHSRDMILSRLSHDLARVRDHDGGVPNYVPLISFQDGRNYNHVIGLGILKSHTYSLKTRLKKFFKCEFDIFQNLSGLTYLQFIMMKLHFWWVAAFLTTFWLAPLCILQL